MAYRDITNTVKDPRIVMSKFGNIKDEEADYIIKVMKECYSRLEPHEVALVDLYIFKYSSSMEAFTAKESKEVGVSSSSFDELFFAMHDAYRGISRIILCLERMEAAEAGSSGRNPTRGWAFSFARQPKLLSSTASTPTLRLYWPFQRFKTICNQPVLPDIHSGERL